MKIILGTANYLNNYGTRTKIDSKEIKKIFKYCEIKKIQYLDTAIDYGYSEKICLKLGINKFKIITKILSSNKLFNNQKNFFKLIKKKYKKNFFSILMHDMNFFKKENLFKLHMVKSLKTKGLVRNIGVSIYTINDLDVIIKSKFVPDILQIPLNVLDTRFDCKKILQLKKKKVKIIVRSIFLQGIILKDFKFFKKFKKLKNFENWCRQNNCSKLDASINFLKNFKFIDFLIVGHDSLYQLDQIFNSFKKKMKVPNYFSMNRSQKLINPSLWRKNKK